VLVKAQQDPAFAGAVLIVSSGIEAIILSGFLLDALAAMTFITPLSPHAQGDFLGVLGDQVIGQTPYRCRIRPTAQAGCS
jgi:hypothetical protein